MIWNSWKKGQAFEVNETTYPFVFEFDTDTAIRLCLQKIYQYGLSGNFLITSMRGNGKTQFVFMLLYGLQKKNIKSKYLSLVDYIKERKNKREFENVDVIILDEIDQSISYYGIESVLAVLEKLLSDSFSRKRVIILTMSNLTLLKVKKTKYAPLFENFRLLINLDMFMDKEKLVRSMSYKSILCYKKLRNLTLTKENIAISIVEEIAKNQFLYQRKNIRETIQILTNFIEKFLTKILSAPEKLNTKNAIIKLISEYFSDKTISIPLDEEIYINFRKSEISSPIIGYIEYQLKDAKGKLGIVIEELPISKKKLEMINKEKNPIFAIIFGKKQDIPSSLKKHHLMILEKKILRNCSYMPEKCIIDYLHLIKVADKIHSSLVFVILDEISENLLSQKRMKETLACCLFSKLYQTLYEKIMIKRKNVFETLHWTFKYINLKVPDENLHLLSESLILALQRYGAIVAGENIFLPRILRRNLVNVLNTIIDELINRLEIEGFL